MDGGCDPGQQRQKRHTAARKHMQARLGCRQQQQQQERGSLCETKAVNEEDKCNVIIFNKQAVWRGGRASEEKNAIDEACCAQPQESFTVNVQAATHSYSLTVHAAASSIPHPVPQI